MKNYATYAEHIAAAAAIAKQDAARRRARLPHLLRIGEALRHPCGCTVMRNHGLDDYPDGPYYQTCEHQKSA